MNNFCCPYCRLSHIKKNGHTHYGKQNYQCLNCSRQFVALSQRIDDSTRELVKRLLLERISLRGICRVLDISLDWLLQFTAEVYDQLPGHLYAKPSNPYQGIQLLRLEDALSFSKKVENHIGAIKYFICHYNQEVIRRFSPALLS